MGDLPNKVNLLKTINAIYPVKHSLGFKGKSYAINCNGKQTINVFYCEVEN